MERWKMLISGTEKQNTSTRGSQKIRRNAAAAAVFILPVLIFLSCRTEVVPQAYRPTNAHEEYEKSLAQAGLSQTALVMDWIASSETALENPIFIYPPFKERVYFDPSKASSVGYSFSVKRGQKISIEPASGTSLSFRLYVDLFRTGTPGNAFIHTASGSENSNNIDIDVRADGEYILRLQPELLRGGSFTVTIQVSSSLAFPVKGHDRLPESAAIFDRPDNNAAIVTLASSGDRVEVFGNFDDFLYIRTQTSEPGWIRLTDMEPRL